MPRDKDHRPPLTPSEAEALRQELNGLYEQAKREAAENEMKRIPSLNSRLRLAMALAKKEYQMLAEEWGEEFDGEFFEEGYDDLVAYLKEHRPTWGGLVDMEVKQASPALLEDLAAARRERERRREREPQRPGRPWPFAEHRRRLIGEEMQGRLTAGTRYDKALEETMAEWGITSRTTVTTALRQYRAEVEATAITLYLERLSPEQRDDFLCWSRTPRGARTLRAHYRKLWRRGHLA